MALRRQAGRRRGRVGAHERVREQQRILCAAFKFAHHSLRQVLKVYLMDDGGGGRDHAQVVKCFRAPAQKLVAFTVALELLLVVAQKRKPVRKVVHLHGVVDHQIDGHQRVDALRVTAQAAHGVAHCSQIHHAWHAGKVLHNHARRHKWQLVCGWLRSVPGCQAFHICCLHEVAVAVAQ